jgi:hypothetical protein
MERSPGILSFMVGTDYKSLVSDRQTQAAVLYKINEK